MRTPRPIAVSLVLTAFALAACGGGSSGPTAPPPTAAVTMSVAPNPVTGHPCTGCGGLAGEKEVVTAITARENAGVGANAYQLSVELRLDGGEVLLSGAFDAAGIALYGGTTRLPASGELNFPQVPAHYPGARAGLSGELIYVLQLVDDNGHQVSATGTTRVTT